MKKFTSYLLLVMVFCTSTVFALPTTPYYGQVFGDAVTGDNEFTNDGTHHWFVNTGADSYANDYYERPTVQTYAYTNVQAAVGGDSELASNVGNVLSAAGSSGATYFGYLDIVNGHFGHDDQYMYFGIELFSTDKVDNTGDSTFDFGESSYYNIRLGEDVNGAGSLMLSGQAASDYSQSAYGDWQTEKAFGYLDTNGDVGGPGGITTVNENPGSMNGFEDPTITDGYLKDMGSEPDMLWTRYNTFDGRPVVEFAFDYVTFNEYYLDYALDPLNLEYLVYEANRGTKDNQNYLWNDKWTLGEAGTPYDPFNGPQNVYELDTLRGEPIMVPAPGAFVLGCIGLGIVRNFRKRKAL